jgi:YidC/Oxa1 family membrane protein insertase
VDISYQFMLPLMQSIATAGHSYGWAIIALTVLIRILLYPLVASSTRSMQKMGQLQPQLKLIQNRYKDEPELFQKKAMEFYQKNKINPLGGCLPTLVQLPILFALFATFTGPPFGDRPVPVKVKVVSQQQVKEVARQEVSGANSPYVSPDGKLAKVVVFPGDSTVVEGSTIDFNVRATDGTLPADFKPEWKVSGDAHGATIDQNGHAVFPKLGEDTIEAVIPGHAKGEKFLFINGLGKVVHGMDLLKPENFDALILIILFGVTMWLSQKLMVQPPAPGADPEQLMIQQQTQKTMPIAVTAMFFFIPLPTGVFLYMVVSNVIQSFQTWMIMRNPGPAIVNVLDGDGGSDGVIDITPKAADNGGETTINTKSKEPTKRKSKKKK